MSGAQDQEIQVRRRLPRFGQVPDAILENRSISLETRAVISYLVGRSDGFRISVGSLCRLLGIKDARWRRIRREMEAARHFLQSRRRNADGTFTWTNEVFDVAYDPATIPPKTTDGKPTRGKAIHGKPTDLPYRVHQTDSTTERERGAASPPPAARAARELSGSGGGGGTVGENGQRYQQTPAGIHYSAGNQDDAAALARISSFPSGEVGRAIQQAQQQEPRGRAFPSAVLRFLLRQASTTGGGGQAELDAFLAGLERAARDEVAEQGAATPCSASLDAINGTFEVLETEEDQ